MEWLGSWAGATVAAVVAIGALGIVILKAGGKLSFGLGKMDAKMDVLCDKVDQLDTKNDKAHASIINKQGIDSGRISNIEGYMNGYNAAKERREQQKLDSGS